jgi:Tfp pilus assembly protein PilF
LEKYRKALNETSEDFVPEVNFLIGRCLVKLGRYADAQAYLEAVPVNNDRTPDAVRLLATSAIETGNFVDAEFWLKRGQEQYSEEFLDSWVDYALIKVAASKGDLAQMKEIQAKTLQKFPPSDHWVNLLNAAVEGYEWQIRAKVKEVQYE